MLSHKGLVIWMTGYSGSGKTSLAYKLERRLHDEGILTKVLDDDALLQGFNARLTSNTADETEDIRRTAEIARQLVSCGVVVICSLITPTNALRLMAEDIIGEQHFILYHIDTPLEVCERRSIKRHYENALDGEHADFTPTHHLFEKPITAIYSIDTSELSIDESVDIMFDDIFPLIAI